ncbi:MAG: PRK06851 family protein [Chloroflexota bacterium]
MTEALTRDCVPGRVRRVFPGNNTAYGFFSFYDQIVGPGANHIFVIKGGPGVGKSTFMRAIGQALVDRGFDVEQHCCSSDTNSLDGIYIPAIDVALIDGTSPHVVDPKNPGAVDEIVHLGDYWNEEGIRTRKDEILAHNREVGRLFRRAYAFLSAAKTFRDAIEDCYRDSGAVDDLALARVAHRIADGLLARRPDQSEPASKGKVRHLFGTAITPVGPLNYLPDTAGAAAVRIVLKGGPGMGGDEVLHRVADALAVAGVNCEILHCPLDPKRYEHVYAPALSAIVMTSAEPHPIEAQPGDEVIDLGAFIDHRALEPYREEIVEATCLYSEAFSVAVESISRAKRLHDLMETCYVPYMDFDRINARRAEVLGKILKLAREQGYEV